MNRKLNNIWNIGQVDGLCRMVSHLHFISYKLQTLLAMSTMLILDKHSGICVDRGFFGGWDERRLHLLNWSLNLFINSNRLQALSPYQCFLSDAMLVFIHWTSRRTLIRFGARLITDWQIMWLGDKMFIFMSRDWSRSIYKLELISQEVDEALIYHICCIWWQTIV